MSDPDRSRYRVLENDIWSDYFSEKQKLKLDHMLAYHWKISPNQNKGESYINSFTLSTKFSFKESSNWKILIVFLIALVLGAVGGVGGNFLTRWIDGTGNMIESTEQAEPQSTDSEEETNKLEKKSGTEDN